MHEKIHCVPWTDAQTRVLSKFIRRVENTSMQTCGKRPVVMRLPSSHSHSWYPLVCWVIAAKWLCVARPTASTSACQGLGSPRACQVVPGARRALGEFIRREEESEEGLIADMGLARRAMAQLVPAGEVSEQRGVPTTQDPPSPILGQDSPVSSSMLSRCSWR